MTKKEKNALRNVAGNLKKVVALLNLTADGILDIDNDLVKESEENDAGAKILADEQDRQEWKETIEDEVAFAKHVLNDPRIEDAKVFAFRSMTSDGVLRGRMPADTFKRLLATFIEKYDRNV